MKPSVRAFILTIDPFPSTLISAPSLVSLTCKTCLPAVVAAGSSVPIPTLPSASIRILSVLSVTKPISFVAGE